MSIIYFQKLRVDENDISEIRYSVADARCGSDKVVALECYSPGTYAAYPMAARLWLAGQKVYMDIASYEPFSRVFGSPCPTVSARRLIVNMEAVVAEVITPQGVECVLPCRLANPTFPIENKQIRASAWE